MSFPAPVTVHAGSEDPQAPLVVLFHGIGEDESMFAPAVPHLPATAGLVLMRGPIATGRGYNWFERRDGRIHPPSLVRVMDWFEAWIDETAAGRPVVVVGFSAGSAFAGSLVLRSPGRYAGAAVLSGAIPVESLGGEVGLAGRLSGLPVFLAVSEQDAIIREEYTRETWHYLVEESGAEVTTRRDPGIHEVTEATAVELGRWLERVCAGLGTGTTTARRQGECAQTTR
ncbi:alpha/beta hydrolase [Nocardioides daejeonensis]|uniref:alpha/beta hydrolase n=1 Tax=Nocardioides daejeonensis TaxID=1046556 RepID=UPI00194F7D2B|nr:serine esterase [Nocardioides daejeonensis]